MIRIGANGSCGVVREAVRWPGILVFGLCAMCCFVYNAESAAAEVVRVALDPTCSLMFNGVGEIQSGLFSFNAPPAEGIEDCYEEANLRHLRFMFVLAQLGHADWMIPEADLALREDPMNPGRVDPAWWPKMSQAFRHSQSLYARTLLTMGQHGLAGHLKLDFLNPPSFLKRDPKRPLNWGGEDTARLIVGMIKAVEEHVPGAHVEAIGVDNEPNLLASASYPGGANDPEAVKDYFALLQPVADLVHRECPGVKIDAPSVAGGLFFYGPWDNFNHWVKPLLTGATDVNRLDVHGYMQNLERLPLELNGSAFRYRVDLGLLRNYEQIEGLTPRPVVIGEHNDWLGADPQKEDYYRNPKMQVRRAHFWLRDLLTFLDEPDKLSLLSCHYSYWKPPPPMSPEFPFNMFDPDTKKPLPSFDAYRVLADLRGRRVWADSPSARVRAASSVRSLPEGEQLALVLFNDNDRPTEVRCELRGFDLKRARSQACRRLVLQPGDGRGLYSEPSSAEDLRRPIRLAPYEVLAYRWNVAGSVPTLSSIDRQEYYGDRVLVTCKRDVSESFNVEVPKLKKMRRVFAEVAIELLGEKEKVDRDLQPFVTVDGNEYDLPQPRFVRFPRSLNYPTQIDANRLDLISAPLPVQLMKEPGIRKLEVGLRHASAGSYRIVFVRLVAEVVFRRR